MSSGGGKRNHKPKSLPSAATVSNDPSTDCLYRCQSLRHADIVMRCAYTGNIELFKHCTSVCSNPWNIRDSLGRNVLMVASSCGHLDIVLWLLKRKGRVKIELADYESRWTALHRAAYYGYAGLMISLRANGGSLDQMDYDKYTPLNIIHYNTTHRERANDLLTSSYLYVWGSNTNMILGHDHVRNTPELLQLPRDYGDVKQVVICKFHSVFLTQAGRVFTCGHGQGGRLGHGNDKTCLSPKLVQGLRNEVCIEVAAARNHTVFLSNSGVVYSCGLNDAHQLGQTPKNQSTNLPHSLSPYQLRSLKGIHVHSIGTGRYHTAVCTGRDVYTCGRNMGQLGHDKSIGSQIQPKLVTGIHVDVDDSIAHFSSSDSAIACITRRKRVIYVCANYRVVRCDRSSVPESLSIAKFVVCASLGELQSKQQKKKGQNNTTPASTHSECGITIGLTDSSNQLWMTHWKDLSKKTFSSPQLVPGSTKKSVIHFCISKSLSIVTPQGEIFSGPLTPSPSLLTLKRIPSIQQATKIFTDYKTNNMAVIQNIYCPLSLPTLERSTFSEDIYGLLTEDVLRGPVHDVTFNVAGKSIKANKLILSSQSSVFSTLFKSSNALNSKLITSYDRDTGTVTLSTDQSVKIFELFLQYVYGGELTIKSTSGPSNTTSTVSSDSPPSTSNSKTSLDESIGDTSWTTMYDNYGYNNRQNSYDILNDVTLTTDLPHVSVEPSVSPIIVLPGAEILYETDNIKQDITTLKTMANGFKVNDLVKRLDSVSCSDSVKTHSCSIKGPQIIVKQDSVPHDVAIISETGKRHNCHKSILVTRSDYFQSMLMMGWRETTTSEETEFNLPFTDSLIEVLIQYLYTDHAPLVEESASLDWLVSALIMADQLLLSRLKSFCELSIANILSLSNVGYLIQLSEVYNAHQLLTSCVEFVCLNLNALLEMGGVEDVSRTILDRISNTYREMHPSVLNRKPLTLKELGMGEIPTNYLSNELVESSDEEGDNSLPRTPSAVTTPTYRAKSPLDTPTSGSKTTPSGNTSARKKRRKKGKSDVPRQQLQFDDRKMNQCNESEQLMKQPGMEEIAPIADDSVMDDVVTEGQLEEGNTEREPTPAWGGVQNSSNKEDLRSIMSTEDELTDTLPSSNKTNTVRVSKAITIPSVVKGVEFNRSMSLPEAMRSPTSPWGNYLSTKVSLKSLMAEEERKSEMRETEEKKKALKIQRQQMSNTSVRQQTIRRGTRRTSFPPLQSNVVSFSDIVSTQQHELDHQLHQLSHKKQFHLIQIEEQAINGLMSLYSARNNPNEFVTIERVPSETINNTAVINRRTSAPPQSTGANSAWTKKL